MQVATDCIQSGGGAVYPAITAPTHMESPAAADEDADWTSYWASLTFEAHTTITAAQ